MTDEIITHCGLVKKVMAKPDPVCFEYRNQFAILGFQRGIGVDIHDLNPEGKLAAQGFQRGEHVCAEMAISPPVEGEDRLTYPASP